ncbi:RagB/SusD family nutrient uptake outer membrane protein, partial [Bacteroides sp.]|uniref:RagB/SusD family nutrient uptake outer membrane protein n=1 Tax=Bacteroides sp. TaxID=29523 RepID=UPI003A918669
EYKTAFIDIYSQDDKRLDATFFQYLFEGKTRGACWKKLMGQSVSGSRFYDSDIPIFRYADVLLMLAECENGLNNPIDCAKYLNEVRQRAYGDKYEDYKYEASDFAANEWAILQERDKELVGEGSRWFDLLRLRDANGKPFVFSPKAHYGSESPILTEAQAYMMLWPVDVQVLNGDPKLTQTPGY